MDLAKFISDFSVVTLTTALVLAPRALDTYWAIREEKKAEQASE
ncbi:MAG TPA: hypothetical protein VGD78_11295 [Chthoniobacterales bacterium]